MKVFIVASLLVVAVSSSLLEKDAVHFNLFKLKHGKTYKDQAEESRRYAIFKENLQKIEQHNSEFNKGLHTYSKGLNKFADLTPAEFRAKLALQSRNRPALNVTRQFELPSGVSVPSSIDWRKKKAVTAVKDQGSCGSCWAFSVVGSTEGAYAIKTGKLVRFSEQQLVDCTTKINYGCAGGFLDDSFSYVKESGLEAESDYPYTASDDSCAYESSKVVTRVSSHVSIDADEGKIKKAVGTVGPVSIAINADDLQFYSDGIYGSTDCDSAALNHGVLIVGYGSKSSEEYWIIKNSWGADWGESGYFRFLYGKNICGVKEDAVYPLI